MKLNTYIFLFKMRMPARIRRIKKKIKQLLCRHRETYFSPNWGWGGDVCKHCGKVVKLHYKSTCTRSSKEER